MALCRFIFQQSNQKDFSYLENKDDVKKLAEAFTVFEGRSKTTTKRLPATHAEAPLADDGHELFLDKNNSYHVVLSYKVLNRIKSDNEKSQYNEIEKKLRFLEKKYFIKYENEIEKILKSSDFINYHDEEHFLIEELTLFKPEEVINLIEAKINKRIDLLNENEELEEKYFEFLLITYLSKIRLQGIDELERRTLLEQRIKSPKLMKVLDENWEKDEVN